MCKVLHNSFNDVLYTTQLFQGRKQVLLDLIRRFAPGGTLSLCSRSGRLLRAQRGGKTCAEENRQNHVSHHRVLLQGSELRTKPAFVLLRLISNFSACYSPAWSEVPASFR